MYIDTIDLLLNVVSTRLVLIEVVVLVSGLAAGASVAGGGPARADAAEVVVLEDGEDVGALLRARAQTAPDEVLQQCSTVRPTPAAVMVGRTLPSSETLPDGNSTAVALSIVFCRRIFFAVSSCPNGRTPYNSW